MISPSPLSTGHNTFAATKCKMIPYFYRRLGKNFFTAQSRNFTALKLQQSAKFTCCSRYHNMICTYLYTQLASIYTNRRQTSKSRHQEAKNAKIAEKLQKKYTTLFIISSASLAALLFPVVVLVHFLIVIISRWWFRAKAGRGKGRRRRRVLRRARRVLRRRRRVGRRAGRVGRTVGRVADTKNHITVCMHIYLLINHTSKYMYVLWTTRRVLRRRR